MPKVKRKTEQVRLNMALARAASPVGVSLKEKIESRKSLPPVRCTFNCSNFPFYYFSLHVFSESLEIQEWESKFKVAALAHASVVQGLAQKSDALAAENEQLREAWAASQAAATLAVKQKQGTNIHLVKTKKALDRVTTQHATTCAALETSIQNERSPTKRKRSGSATYRPTLHRWVTRGLELLTKLNLPDEHDMLAVISGMQRRLEPEGDDEKAKLIKQIARLAGRNNETLSEVLPPLYLEEVQRKAVQEAADMIQARWNTLVGLSIKTRCLLSNKKWQRLRRELGLSYDESTGLHTPIELPYGVVMPILPTNYAICKDKLKLREQYGVTLHGTTVELDLETKLRADVAQGIQDGFFQTRDSGVVVQADNKKIDIQIMADEAYICKGLSTTTLGYHFPKGSRAANSPGQFKTIGLLEGGDGWESLRKEVPQTIKSFNSLMEADDPFGSQFKWLGGGDLKAISSSLGLTGCASPCPCPYCECPRTEMCETDQAKAMSYEQRSLRRIRELAHLVPNVKCPGCKFLIVENVTDSKRQMKLAKIGDDQPAVPAQLKGRNESWQQMHCGVAYARHSHFPIEPLNNIPCTLHACLRVVGGLMTKTVYNQIGKNKQRGEKQEQKISDVLQSKGIHVRTTSIKPKSKNISKAKQDFKQHSFAGREAETLLHCYQQLLEIVCPHEVRAKDTVVANHYNLSMAAWGNWAATWALLNAKRSDWEVWANECATAINTFISSWVKAVGGATKGVYLHILQSHVPHFIRTFGDLGPYSSQGMEHAHKRRKQYMPLGTNFKPGQRAVSSITQILSLEKVEREVQAPSFEAEFLAEKKERERRAIRKAAKHTSWEHKEPLV
jgi:hypothetical protein